MLGRILITDHFHPLLGEQLEAGGYTVDWQPDISQEQTATLLGGYTGLVVATRIQVTRAMLQAAPQLRFVARGGSGMEHIDRQAASELGIECLSTPEGNADAVGEHALGTILALFRHLLQGDRQMRAGIFDREANRGLELGGRTVGIVGYGHTGTAFARRLRGMEVQVLAHDLYKSGFGDDAVQESSLEEITERADVLSLHLPLSPETRYYLNRELIARFARPFYLINTSRGNVVDTRALLEGLDQGAVLGAALDVFEHEKPQQYGPQELHWWEPLKASERVLLSPHVAGLTRESRQRIAEWLVKKIFSLQV
jgi:D-3-phosphoglycerate dehydrogenase / 2-oxoglutarate reductase